MDRKKKSTRLLQYAKELFPDAKTELENWKTPFQFLVCVVLSAQATDKGVNKVTKKLFKKYPTPESLSKASLTSVTEQIKSINYFNSKAKHIIDLAKILVSKYNSAPPKTVSKLINLPGVGYKTANVFINVIYPELCQGIAVDTHVDRVVKRFGLIENEKLSATKVAKELESIYNKEDWKEINATFVLFGRYFCKAKKPLCDSCLLNRECPFHIKS